MSNSQLNKLKSGIENGTKVTLNFSSNLIGNSNDETNFSYKLLLTNAQVSKIRKAFENDSSANLKFSKTELSKIVKSGELIFSSSGIFDLSMAPIKGFFSLANSKAKESKNMGAKQINNDILVDAGITLLGKKNQRRNFINYRLRCNSNKQ